MVDKEKRLAVRSGKGMEMEGGGVGPCEGAGEERRTG